MGAMFAFSFMLIIEKIEKKTIKNQLNLYTKSLFRKSIHIGDAPPSHFKAFDMLC